MEFEGTVYKVLPVVKGTSQRGEWMKQEVVFELPGEFNRKICVGFWGDKAHDAGTLREGDKVAVSINVESREYNGRWFTEELEKDVQAAKERLDHAPADTPSELLKAWRKEYDDLVFRLDNLYDDEVNEFTD